MLERVHRTKLRERLHPLQSVTMWKRRLVSSGQRARLHVPLSRRWVNFFFPRFLSRRKISPHSPNPGERWNFFVSTRTISSRIFRSSFPDLALIRARYMRLLASSRLPKINEWNLRVSTIFTKLWTFKNRDSVGHHLHTWVHVEKYNFTSDTISSPPLSLCLLFPEHGIHNNFRSAIEMSKFRDFRENRLRNFSHEATRSSRPVCSHMWHFSGNKSIFIDQLITDVSRRLAAGFWKLFSKIVARSTLFVPKISKKNRGRERERKKRKKPLVYTAGQWLLGATGRISARGVRHGYLRTYVRVYTVDG